MKIKIYILLLAVIALFVPLLGETNEVHQEMSIHQISAVSHIPMRKIIEYLELPPDTDINKPVIDLNRDQAELQKAVTLYHKNQQNYYWGIVVIGMTTVFASLIIVALIIGQLRHLSKKKDSPIAGLSDDIVAAIVTTLYLHEMDVEENNRLLLTWKRAPLSMWKASNYIPMNEIDPSRRK